MNNFKKLTLLIAAGAVACAPSVPQVASPGSVTTAVFDPTTGNIPLPNDLALQPGAAAALPQAEQDLLAAFAQQKGFPNDQEVPVTISFTTQNIAADGTTNYTAPDLDLTSFTPTTLLVLLHDANGIGPVALDPIQAGDYVKTATSGTLTLHHAGHAPWAPGEYIVGVRGGPNGIKTVGGSAVYASTVFYLVAQGKDLNNEQGLGLLRAQAGSTAAAQQLAAQLDVVIDLYNSAGVFQAVDSVFPQQELAVMTTFAVAPASTMVELDPTRGVVPLPIDLLRDPRPVGSCTGCGLLTPLAACTFASGHYNAATGACTDSAGNPDAAAGGFSALDGFSTTGMMLVPLTNASNSSILINASTVTASTVQLYDLTNPASPQLVDPTTYITEPAEVTQSGFSPIIALQPAGVTGGDTSSVFRTRPLKDNTEYAVVLSNKIKDQSGNPLTKGTVATVLQLTSPLVSATGTSNLTGIDNNTAGALEVMRQQLAPVLAKVNQSSSFGSVAMAYTFKTQSILNVATQLGALPYTQPAATGNPSAITAETAAAAFAKYGVDPSVVPNTNIDQILETTITTFNLLDPTTGAFNPTGATNNETINVLIATPKAGGVPACSGALAAFGAAGIHCSPLIVFRHGLGGGRADMLTVADTFTSKGFTVVAIDAAKHGDRAFCMPSGPAQQCASGFTCQSALPPGAQADTSPPGCCIPTGSTPGASTTISCGTTSGFQYLPVSAGCAVPGSCGGYAYTEGVPAVSAQYLISANFFRTRDTFRQDFIDESQLVRAIAFVPTGLPPTGHNLFDYMVERGVVVDPLNISYVGQSLGSIQGTGDVATNPRIEKAVLNVGGGTVVDVFTNSPSFYATTQGLLAGLGITQGANSGYLQFLIVAKTILDPAEPLNYADHLTSNTLPNLLPPLGGNTNGSVPQSPKSVLTQVAYCDQTVPNPFEFILDSNITCGETGINTCAAGAAQLPYGPTFGAGTGDFQIFYNGTTGTNGGTSLPNLLTCPSPAGQQTPVRNVPGQVDHAFITDWVDGNATLKAQTDAASFLSTGAAQPSLEVVP